MPKPRPWEKSRRIDPDRSLYPEKRFTEEFRAPWRRILHAGTFVVTGALAYYMVFHYDYRHIGRVPEKHVFSDLRSWYNRQRQIIWKSLTKEKDD
ncbi:hypothetical protein AAMO2058_000507800 [Amorphochlora amoebiformis]